MTDENKEPEGYEVYVNVRLPKGEYDRLKLMIKREEAVSWMWSWFRNFLFVAVPVTTLYSFYELLKNGK